ncbi:hypothetical protein HUT11_22440 [Streptomyces seoulensis]|nr:hypothetical protein HUT11_22440 [Streptomyces seoulensis]
MQEIASVLIGEVREEGVDELGDNHPLGLWMPLLDVPDDLLDVDARWQAVTARSPQCPTRR